MDDTMNDSENQSPDQISDTANELVGTVTGDEYPQSDHPPSSETDSSSATSANAEDDPESETPTERVDIRGHQALTPEGTSAAQATTEEAPPATAPVKKPKAAPKAAAKMVARELSPEQTALPWYVVHTYSGYEMRAKLSLEERIRSHGMEKKFGQILVPQETVVELVRGQKKTSKRKFFPGYILVQVQLDDESWHLVKDTPKVTGFVGDSRNPSPITQEEVDNLTKQMEGGAQKPRPKVHFEEGDAIKVIDGPFAEFNGTVDEVKPDKGKLRVLISIFGRNTPVELDFVQVEKA